MTEVGIDNSQFYGRQSISNGRIIAIAVSPTEWTVAVSYGDGHLVMVSRLELLNLMEESGSLNLDQLVATMAQRLGMVGHMIDFTAANGVIPLAVMVIDALNNGNKPLPGRGTLQLIGAAA